MEDIVAVATRAAAAKDTETKAVERMNVSLNWLTVLIAASTVVNVSLLIWRILHGAPLQP